MTSNSILLLQFLIVNTQVIAVCYQLVVEKLDMFYSMVSSKDSLVFY